MAESEEELKSLLMKVKEENEKAGLKPSCQKTKIMASDPITSWQIDGETMETVTDFLFLGSKIIADGDCSHEIKRSLLLGRKAMTPRQHIKKQRKLMAIFPKITYKYKVTPIKISPGLFSELEKKIGKILGDLKLDKVFLDMTVTHDL